MVDSEECRSRIRSEIKINVCFFVKSKICCLRSKLLMVFLPVLLYHTKLDMRPIYNIRAVFVFAPGSEDLPSRL